MKILTHLSKEKINSIVQSKESYNFYIDIDNKKYEATLCGYPIIYNAFGEVINSKIKIRNISFEDMSILNFQTRQKIKVDDENYYITSLEVDGFHKRAEVTAIKMK